jgi:hypothetical protein
MTRNKCSLCDRPAIAYQLDDDGTKTYLCDRHIPQEERVVPVAAQSVMPTEMPIDENL